MSLKYKEYVIPDSLCYTIRRLSLSQVGIYNGEKHCFHRPILDPQDNELRQIKAEFEKNEELRENVDFLDMVYYVLDQTSVEARDVAVASIHVGKEAGALKAFQHIVIHENSGAVTELLYLYENRFYVLYTTRGTILQGDVLVANTLPLRVDDSERPTFAILRDGERFIPEVHAGKEASFMMHPITGMSKKITPEIYNVIDEDERYGECKLSDNRRKLTPEQIHTLIDNSALWVKVLDGALPENAPFPEYDMMLAGFKQNGASCYVLNLLLESLERRDKMEYGYEQDDWHVTVSDEERKRMEAEEFRKNKEAFEQKSAELDAELAKIRTRRVMLFFKAEGRIGDMEYMNQLEADLDALAAKGFGTKGRAKQRRLDAIANSKPHKGENALTAVKLIGSVALLLLSAWLWMASRQGKMLFDVRMEQAEMLLAEGDYNGARAGYLSAYEQYSPKVTSFLVYGKHNSSMKRLEDMIDEDVEQGLSQIEIMRSASNGRFEEKATDILFSLLELRPEDERLLKLHEQYLEQMQ